MVAVNTMGKSERVKKRLAEIEPKILYLSSAQRRGFILTGGLNRIYYIFDSLLFGSRAHSVF